jgi:hypothetical protein
MQKIDFKVKPAMAMRDGWLIETFATGLRMTYRQGLFGRTIWLAKKDGAFVQFTQGKDVALNNVIESPSKEQTAILMALSKLGLLTSNFIDEDAANETT